MFSMFTRFFAMVGKLFGIIEVNLDSVERISAVGNTMAQGFQEVATLESQEKTLLAKAALAKTKAMTEKPKAVA